MITGLRVLVLLLGGASAPEPTMLVVDGACDDAGALRERLVAVLPVTEAPLGAVRLHVEPDGAALRGSLVFDVDGLSHERRLAAESCAALYEASALVVALAVKPDVPAVGDAPHEPNGERASAATTSPSLAEPRPPTPGDGRASDAEARSPPTISRELDGRVQLGGGVAVGVLHPVHPLLTAGGDLSGRRWAVGLDALYLPPLAAEPAPRVRAVVQLLAASVRGCSVWWLAHDRLVVPVCAGVAVGRSWGRGEGEAIVGHRGSETWVAGLVGPRARLRARWGGELWLAAELVVPLRRLNFVIGELGAACCESPLGVMLSLGAGFWGPRQRS